MTIAIAATAASLWGAEPEQEPAEPAGKLVFWHTQGQDRAQLLDEIIADYNASNPPMLIEPIYKGSYSDIFRATLTNLQAGSPPDLAIAYESMVAQYHADFEIIANLDATMRDPEIGLEPEEIEDYYSRFLEQNRYPQFDGAMLSFPFTKSLLILYANEDMLAEAGFSGPPKTWDEFSEQCLAMQKIGKRGYPITVDASTLDGMFMSRGAQLLADDLRTTGFDQPGVARTLGLLRELSEAGALYQLDGASDQDMTEFVQQNAPFFIRSSTRRPTLQDSIGDDFVWTMNRLPSGEGAEPMTVLYGGNICVFKTGEERVRAAWDFIKYFTSPEVTARWAVGSGYLPVRRSASELRIMNDFLEAHPVNRQFIELAPFGRGEPAPAGWQDVRAAIVETVNDAITGRGGKSPEELAAGLKARADQLLIPSAEQQGRRGVTLILIGVLALVALVSFIVRRGA